MSDSTGTPAGWYQDKGDPTGRTMRYWDGSAWTDDRKESSSSLRSDIEAAVNRMRWTLGSKREIKKLEPLLHQDEAVREMAGGQYGGRTGILVLTDQRLLFFNQGWTGASHEDFPLSVVSSVGYSGGMMLGEIKIHASGNIAEIDSMQKKDAQRLAGAARAAIIDAKSTVDNKPQSGSSTDPMDQIRKLGELRDAGVLTEQEFADKKATLLKLI